MEANSFKDQKPVIAYNTDVPIGTVFTCLFKNNTKLDAQLVGYEHDGFFLLKFPTISGIANYLTKDAPIAALFKANGFNITFATTLSLPIPRKFLSFCNYPSKFKLYEIRNTTRADCLLPMAITVDGVRFFGVVQDISMDGCRITFDGVEGTDLRKLDSGDSVLLEIWTQKEAINAKVIIMRAVKNINRISFGVSFTELTKMDTAAIQGFILSLKYTGVVSQSG